MPQPAALALVSRRTWTVVCAAALFFIMYTIYQSYDLDIPLKSVLHRPSTHSSPGINDTTLRGPHMAVVIETHFSKSKNLMAVMMHYSAVLGPGWPIVLYTLESTWDDSVEVVGAAFRRAQAAGQIHVRFLPPQTDLSTSERVSVFLTGEWLYTQLLDVDRILLFQTDAIICAKAPMRVDDFLEWDFIGAPIEVGGAHNGYNGGLCLRNPRVFLDVVRNPNKPFSYINEGEPIQGFEDRWFSRELKERGAHLPNADIARRFSLEHKLFDYPTPVGYHQPQFWNGDNENYKRALAEYCPEAHMLVGKRAPILKAGQSIH